jgi:phytoene dehydrogenase-like protein
MRVGQLGRGAGIDVGGAVGDGVQQPLGGLQAVVDEIAEQAEQAIQEGGGDVLSGGDVDRRRRRPGLRRRRGLDEPRLCCPGVNS